MALEDGEIGGTVKSSKLQLVDKCPGALVHSIMGNILIIDIVLAKRLDKKQKQKVLCK